jgi:hypothetical protein
MADTDSANDGTAPERGLEDCLGFARAHSDTSDTRQSVADLEDMLLRQMQGICWRSPGT